MTMADSDIEVISCWGGGYLEKIDKKRMCREKRTTTDNVAFDYLAIQNRFMKESTYLLRRQYFSFSLVYPIPNSAITKKLAAEIRHVDSEAEVQCTTGENIDLSTICVCANIQTAVKVMDHVLKFVRNVYFRDPCSVTVARKEKHWFLSDVRPLFEKYAIVPHVHSENENFTLYTLVKEGGAKFNNLLNYQQQIQQLQLQLFQIQQYQKQQQGQQFQQYNSQLYNGCWTPLPNTNAYTYAAAVQQQQQANWLQRPYGHQHTFYNLPVLGKSVASSYTQPTGASVTTPGADILHSSVSSGPITAASASAIVANNDMRIPHA